MVARFSDGTGYSPDELPEALPATLVDFGRLNQDMFSARSPDALREDVLTTEYDYESRLVPVCDLVMKQLVYGKYCQQV